MILVSLLTSALAATGTTYLIQRYQVFPAAPAAVAERRVSAPSLVGLSEQDARANAQALRLALIVEGREPAAGVAPGTVLRQSVVAGQSLAEGTGVGVVFAAPLPTVPKLLELDLAAAARVLEKRGFRLAEGAPVPDGSLPPGKIARQVPEPDEELEAGGTVTVHVSSGPAAVDAPKLTGLSLRTAQQKLGELGLEARVKWISRAETVTGIVLSQKPVPGEKLPPKSAVEVVVNR